MIAIETKYIGPTNTKPARIVAETCNGHRLVMSRHEADELDGEDLHRVAAERLATGRGWLDGFKLVGGGSKAGYVFVFVKA